MYATTWTNHQVKQKKSITRDYVLCDSTYMKIWERQNVVQQVSGCLGHGAGEVIHTERLKETFRGDGNVLSLDYGYMTVYNYPNS